MCLLEKGENRNKVRGLNKDNPLKVNVFFEKTQSTEDFIVRVLFAAHMREHIYNTDIFSIRVMNKFQ